MPESECPVGFPITLCPPAAARGAYPETDKPKKVHPMTCGSPFYTRREHLNSDDDFDYES